MNNNCNRNWNGWGGCSGCGSWGCRGSGWGSCGQNCGCTSAHTLSGIVTGTTGPAAGVAIEYTVNGTTYTAVTGAGGRYSVTVPRCANVTVTVGPAVGVTVTPHQYVINDVCADWERLDFTLTPVVSPAYTVSGTVSGLASNANVTVSYAVNGTPGSTQTDALGNYRFTAPVGANVTITATGQPGYLVLPAGYSLAPIAGDVPGRDFVYVPQARTAVISGSLRNASGAIAGAVVSYALNGQTQTTTTDASGNYAFTVPAGSSVTIAPPSIPGATPSPASISLMNVAGNTGGQNFFYTPLTGSATVSGQVMGLMNNVGVAVSYSIDGSAASTVTGANGLYSISAPFGSSVTVTAVAQPGYTVSPLAYNFNSIAANWPNQNFTYTAI